MLAVSITTPFDALMATDPQHPAALSENLLSNQCETQTTKRSGPGGQHRNKVESAIVIKHLPTGIIGQAGERRSQHENRAQAFKRLRVNLALGYRRELDINRYRRSKLWQARLKAKSMVVSRDHDDFPALLAEALDVLHWCDFDVKAAANTLSVTPSQLVKFLRLEPQALVWLNRGRSERGLGKIN